MRTETLVMHIHTQTQTRVHRHILTKTHMPPSLNVHSGFHATACAVFFVRTNLMYASIPHRLRYSKPKLRPSMTIIITTTIHSQHHNRDQRPHLSNKAKGHLRHPNPHARPPHHSLPYHPLPHPERSYPHPSSCLLPRRCPNLHGEGHHRVFQCQH